MIATILLSALLASVIDVPTNLTSQAGSSVVSSKDKRSGWAAEWGMEETTVAGRKAVRFSEKGSGRLSTFPDEVRWTVHSTWLAASTFAPLDTEKTVTTMEGKVLLVERKHFDHAKGEVRFERLRTGERPETTSLAVPADTLAIEGLAGILRFASVPKSRSLAAHVLTNEPSVYSVTFERRDEEKVKTPAGEFHCYKVEMVPHLGVLNLVRPFLQKTFFWFTVSVPHNWIRYEGPESGPGTPGVVMELSRTAL